MEYKEMCKIMHPYTCPTCGNDMLFFTRTNSNMIIDYKNLMQYRNNNDIMDYLGEKNVEYLKCVACKKIYIIDWTRGYARPLIYKDTLKQFGYTFKE